MINPFSKPKISPDKGYTLLFAVIVATLVLSVAAFILSISRKQFILSSAARDSLYAFYAADSGIECAVQHFQSGDFDSKKILNNTDSPVQCAGSGWTAFPSTSGSLPAQYRDTVPATQQHATTTFFMPIGTSGSCAWIEVGYGADSTGTTTYIESRGYNIGWNTTVTPHDCSTYGPRKVERALVHVYTPN